MICNRSDLVSLADGTVSCSFTGFRFFADGLAFSDRVLMHLERPQDLRLIPFDNTVINQISTAAACSEGVGAGNEVSPPVAFHSY